jgi:hypothetical protein
MALYHKTKYGLIVLGDSLEYLGQQKDHSIDLVVTSPPFGLVRKKAYGNVESHEYIEWFKPFGKQFKRVLKQSGSLVIDIGGAWNPGQPTRSLYHFELAIMLHREIGLCLAQEFFWCDLSKLPSPAGRPSMRPASCNHEAKCEWWPSPAPWREANREAPPPDARAMKALIETSNPPENQPRTCDA